MANTQFLIPGFPFPVYVNQTATKQYIAPSIYVDEVVTGGGGTAALASLLAFKAYAQAIGSGATSLAGKISDACKAFAATTQVTALAGKINDAVQSKTTTTQVTALTGLLKDTVQIKAATTQSTALAGNIKDTSALTFVTAQVTALSVKATMQCKTKISGAFTVGIAAKTAFMSTGKGVIAFISALFATITMQSTARAIATRNAGIQGLIKASSRLTLASGSFPVNIAGKMMFASKGVGTIAFLVSLLALTAMRSGLKGLVASTTSLQGLVRASSRIKITGSTLTVGILARAAFAAAFRAAITASGGAIITLHTSAYIARSPFGMYCARAVDKYIVQSHIGQYIARGGRSR